MMTLHYAMCGRVKYGSERPRGEVGRASTWSSGERICENAGMLYGGFDEEERLMEAGAS